MSPTEFRLIGGKSHVTERYQDSVDKQGDRQTEHLAKEAQQNHQANLKDIPDVDKSEMATIEKNKRLEEEQKKKKREKNKKNQKKSKALEQESGLMIDLEG